eukprot:TRINITY_DN615_c0_g1_i1.p1 TRINITY_DN615_c0_g1~~TRINITY_DN615_c0_g1_i1.p1  ORF type:complete len:111 (-),score=55.32 TRINITY_DN615_c0_g1_i1:106-438(-)
MTMWADNIKFVKDIIDGKYQKIDAAAAEMTENAEALLKDPNCGKSKEHFSSAVRVLELVQTSEIEMLLETIIGDLHGKEKEMLVNESKEKINTRTKALDRAKEVKAQLKI